ncbi:uncharacterized protein BDR25DRAFT_345727 [Lindgomyces ingoldianus]|uniref:Uncharacterized protein n=1 Tax=Lindgomyces ingoldianus TaxID=673940 RepID=A0ACB6QHT1_9PLEO|nr:uncharacterized protein BDR25DRAFT_345727 [Lindgomyces ingoldianus]KAF2466133.1 hypothetical protein BDR25DRAFT_345727 [Lindgomyces ingoldianus]
MKFFTTFTTAALMATVSSLAVETRNTASSNIDLGVMELPVIPQLSSNETATGVSKRDVNLMKRESMIVDVWADDNFSGRHEALSSDLNHCYGLGNGWNDIISSLRVQSGYGCVFYVDSNCKGNTLTVRGDTPYLRTIGWSDVISSYLCYK